ncbi:hypothetical protein RF11_10660 [Thelohanellus kitauei]|uniref:Uncharacterized protein n=1 Tax=Thelohanellus kitauei TaxID=669202 RepID=A0A0C2MXK2_THEKT|nr:hypothetical protein RF11_10660 [Thelohanellus kitauei]
MSEFSENITQTIYLYNNGERTLSVWKPEYESEAIFVDEFFAVKYVLFGISSLKHIFIYVDNALKIFSVQTYETHATIIPSRFDPCCVIKIIPNSYQVSVFYT